MEENYSELVKGLFLEKCENPSFIKKIILDSVSITH